MGQINDNLSHLDEKLNKTILQKVIFQKEIHSKIGFSNNYTNKITEDFIEILKECIKKNETNIKKTLDHLKSYTKRKD